MEIREEKMNVIIYTRVSTKEQVDGYSLTYQEKICREHAERQGWNVIQVFQEQGESAKTADRTQLLKLLEFCHKNKGKVDILLVHKLDRFSRNTIDHGAVRTVLAKVGVSLRSVSEQIDDTPSGKLMENIFSAVAQFDNDVRSERTKEGMKEKIRQGHWPWKAPLGYRNSPGGLMVDEERSSLIKKAFEIYSQGGYTITAVTEKLNIMGLTTEVGNKITPQYMTKIFNNKLYMGIVEGLGVTQEGAHKPLIDKDLFYTVEAIRTGKSVQINIPHFSKNPQFPLKNIVVCKECGKSLTGSLSKGRSKKYPYYHCICGGVRIKKEVLENTFYEYMKSIRPNQDFKKLFKVLLVNVWKKKHNELSKSLIALDNEIIRLKELKNKLLQKNLEGIVSDKDYRELSTSYDEQITVKEIQSSEYRRNEIELNHMISIVDGIFVNIASIWFESSFENKQRFQALVFPKGLPVSNDGFGTTTLGFPFNLIRDFAGDETTLVIPRELEP